jgi:hypothetical protein
MVASAVTLFFLPVSLVSQQPVSHARVVKLSYVSGTVAVKGAGATKWAKAMVNTPLQEGFEISTSADSFAEVEFENGSTARLGQLSHLTFDQLALDPAGDKLNRMTFERGYATFHILPEKRGAYSIKMARVTLTPMGKSLFRTDLGKPQARVEVFNGSVEVVGPSSSAKLGKDKVLEFNPGTTEVAFNTRRGIVKDSWDKWAEARDSQSSLALRDHAAAVRALVDEWNQKHLDVSHTGPMRGMDSSMSFPRP